MSGRSSRAGGGGGWRGQSGEVSDPPDSDTGHIYHGNRLGIGNLEPGFRDLLGTDWEPGTGDYAISQHPGAQLGSGDLGIYCAKRPPGRPSREPKPLISDYARRQGWRVERGSEAVCSHDATCTQVVRTSGLRCQVAGDLDDWIRVNFVENRRQASFERLRLGPCSLGCSLWRVLLCSVRFVTV